MHDVVTEDWSEFGYREKDMGIELLQAWHNGRVVSGLELGDNVRVAFNRNSGYVFLTNNNYDAFMLDPDKDNQINIFLSCPNCGNEGFPQYLYDNPQCDECKSFAKPMLDPLNFDDDEDDGTEELGNGSEHPVEDNPSARADDYENGGV